MTSITIAIPSILSFTPMYMFAINIIAFLICSIVASVCLLPVVTLYDWGVAIVAAELGMIWG